MLIGSSVRCAVLVLLLSLVPTVTAAEIELLNVSYDPTRELYADFNRAFAAHWKAAHGDTVKIQQSHGGSGKQARSVIDGLAADVVTLALAGDVDAIANKGKGQLLSSDWQKRLPDNSAPYTSTIVLVVRKGNPKGIKDWDDLVRTNVAVITANPKSSGGARWNYLAAWGYANRKFSGDTNRVEDFMLKLFRNVPVLDTGARGSTTTFVQRGIGDVLIAWENEAILTVKESRSNEFAIVVPSSSILAEPSVAVVDRVAKRKGTQEIAKAYLEYLYSEEGQEIVARNYYRPRLKSVADRHASDFPKLELLSIDRDFGGWTKAQKEHFDDGGSFDRILAATVEK